MVAKSNVSVVMLDACLKILLLVEITVGSKGPETVSDGTEDYIRVLNVPELLQSNTTIVVSYRCTENCIAGVEVRVDTPRHQRVKLFQDLWMCGKDSGVKQRHVVITLPDHVAYKKDAFNRNSIVVQNPKIRTWLCTQRNFDMAKKYDLVFEQAFMRASFDTKIASPYSRPAKLLDRCLSWDYDLMANLSAKKIPKCVNEEEVVHILNYPTVLNGLNYGIYHSFSPYKNKRLERNRLTHTIKPQFTFSMWVYILEHCSAGLCGLMHHLSVHNEYLTPLLLLNTRGRIHIQIQLQNGQTSAVLTSFSLPKYQWIRIVFTFDSVKWSLIVNYGKNWTQKLSTEYMFSENVMYNDASGLFAFGGSESLLSFLGYIGQVTYYRHLILPADKIPIPSLHHPMFELSLTQRYERCKVYLYWAQYKAEHFKRLKQKKIVRSSCVGYFRDLLMRIQSAQPSQCSIYSRLRPKFFKLAKKLIKRSVFRTNHDVSWEQIGEIIFQNTMEKLEDGFQNIYQLLPYLKQAACLKNFDAMYMLAVILNNGISVKMDEIQAHAFLMLATLEKHRLATLALGHRYNYGLAKVPYNKAAAYMYYKYVADKTRVDKEAHKDADVLTESIHLNDEEKLSEQTDEKGDVFMWLKHQAKQGVLQAQQQVGRALYWGAQGLKRNMQSAIEYLKMGAETQDPVAAYDYGVVLLRGQGTKKNVNEGLKQLQKSAKMHHPAALNALGWYALEYDRNYIKAVEYFEEAAKLGSTDATFHLGHLYFNGLYPGQKADQDKAFYYFQKAAVHGQMEAGLMLAFQTMRGTPQMSRNVYLAVEWARYIAEKNPALGFILRKGLHAYRSGNSPLSAFYYILAAEAGVEVGTFNAGWLCEENKEGFVSYIEKECVWRNFNLSTLREPQFVATYSLIKMGDYHWYGCSGHRDAAKAADFYSQAAVRGDPHATFNLAFMVEEGIKVDSHHWRQLDVPDLALKDNVTLLVELYTRCRESRQSEAYLPCSLALFRVQLMDTWIKYHVWMKFSSVLGLAVVSAAAIYRLIFHCHHNRMVNTV